MENQLLEAIVCYNNLDTDKMLSYLNQNSDNATAIIYDILDLLERQRQKCADKAVAKREEDFLGGEWLSVNQDSILNAKLF